MARDWFHCPGLSSSRFLASSAKLARSVQRSFYSMVMGEVLSLVFLWFSVFPFLCKVRTRKQVTPVTASAHVKKEAGLSTELTHQRGPDPPLTGPSQPSVSCYKSWNTSLRLKPILFGVSAACSTKHPNSFIEPVLRNQNIPYRQMNIFKVLFP